MKLYSADGKPMAAIVDMDGTLVDTSPLVPLLRSGLGSASGGMYDTMMLDEFHRRSTGCGANWDIVDKVEWEHRRGLDIVILTARSEKYRKQTERWLHQYCIPNVALYMRAEDDTRPDEDVKRDWLVTLRETWDVVSAFDDNPRVLDMFTREGLKTHRVPGWIDL